MSSTEREIGELFKTKEKDTFHWLIAYIFTFPEELGKSYRSSVFYFNDACWFMRIYLCGTGENQQKVGLCLSRADSGLGQCPPFELSIPKLQADARPAWKLEVPMFLWKRVHFIQTFADAPLDKLIVTCTFNVASSYTLTGSLFSRLWNLSRDMEAMLNGERDTDFAVKVGNKRMKVHRAVLESRSEYFTGMLSHDLRENATGQEEIEDIEPDVFKEILSYLYSGEPSLSKENVCGVFVAADKLLLKELKTLCTRYMRQELEPILVCNVLVLADKYQEGELKEDAMKYIGKNACRVFPLDEWKGFKKENPRLACEVLECVIEKKVFS